MMRPFSILILFLGVFFFGCRSEKQNIENVFLCAIEQLLKDNEFKPELIQESNYLSWQTESPTRIDSIPTEGGLIAFRNIETISVDKNKIKEALNVHFKNGLTLINEQEAKEKLRFERKEKFCFWGFSPLKKHKNKFFITATFAVSSKAGISAFMIIDMDQSGKCSVIKYEPAIF